MSAKFSVAVRFLDDRMTRLIRDIDAVERVQRRATKTVPGIQSRCNGLRVYAVCGCNKVRLPGTGQSAHVIGGSRFTRPASNSRRTLLN